MDAIKILLVSVLWLALQVAALSVVLWLGTQWAAGAFGVRALAYEQCVGLLLSAHAVASTIRLAPLRWSE